MPTQFGTLTPAEIQNGWTPETLAAYHAEREDAAGLSDGKGGIARLVPGNTVTEYTRAPPPIVMETAMKFNPHKWGRR